MSESNGDTKAKLVGLETKLAELRLQARVLNAERGLRRLKESTALDYDWVGPWQVALQRFTDDPSWLPVGSTSARKDGAYFPFFQTEQQLGILRDLSRIVAQTNNHAGGLLNGLTSFVIGTGFKFKVSAKNKEDKDSPARLTAFLDKWAVANDWNERQQEAYVRTREDGECFLRMFPDDDGLMKVRFVWPEQVTQPPGTSFHEYSFGVRQKADDAEMIEEYHVGDMRNPAAMGELVPSDEIVHLKANSRTGIKRGLPDFAFNTKDTLDAAARLTRNMGEGAAIREAIAYIRQHAAAGEDEVTEFVDGQSNFSETSPPSSTRRRSVTQLTPGTIEDVPEGLESVAPPANAGTPAHVSVVDVLLRSGGVKWNGPEWLTSGNASNMGAYTSSTVAESPFVRSVVRMQEYSRVRYLRIVTAAARLAEAAGLIPAGTLAACELDLVPPTAETRNKLEEAQRAGIEVPLGVDSRQNYCSAQGRDFDRIDADNRTYTDEHGQQGSPLPLPGEGGGLPSPTEPAGPALESLAADVARLSDGLRRLLEHGPPPRPGLTFDQSSHRWIRPDGTPHDDSPIGDAASDPAKAGAIRKAMDRVKSIMEKTPGGKHLLKYGGKAVKIGVAIEHRLSIIQHKAHDIAKEAAKNRGMSEAGVKTLGRCLVAADLVGGFAMGGAAHAAGLPIPIVKSAGLVPSLSVAYLMYSAARNPVATWNAAKTVMAATFKKGGAKHESLMEADFDTLMEGADFDLPTALADRLSKAKDTDWAEALWHAALAQAGGDVRQALTLYDAAIAASPDAPPETRTESLLEAKDATGHEHKGKGPGGGEFTSGGGGGGAGNASKKKSDDSDKGGPKGPPVKANTPSGAGGDAERMSAQARAVVKKIKPTKERAFTGEAAGGKIDSRLAGAIGEEILIQHLKSLGYADAGQTSDFLKDSHNNLPFDLIHDHQLIEAKAGQANNPDGVWALKYDGKFTKEQEAKFAKMSPEKVKLAKKKINAAKVKAIHDRKDAFVERLHKQLGFEVKPGMMTVIINPDTKTADIFKFDGIHDRIPFKSDMAQRGYVGSVKYGG